MAQVSTLPPPVRDDAPKGARMIDIAGLIRQASTPVRVHQLLRSGKGSIKLISREKIDILISRAIRDAVEKYRAAGAPPIPTDTEAKGGVVDLQSQHELTAQAGDALARSRLELERELQDMRDDLAQQRALADGRLPADVERAMAESRFERLNAHLGAMDRALGTLFSSKLYSYRQIQYLLRQAAAVRKTAAQRVFPPAAPAPVARPDAARVVVTGGRRIQPFRAMDLELGRGLDVGTAHIRAAARGKGTGETAYNVQRNAFLDVRDDGFARKLLKYGIDYVVRGERGYVIGDPAFEFANIFEKSVRHPMKEGMIASDEPDAILIVNHLVEEILGPPREPGEVCAFSIPGDPVQDDRDFIYHRGVLESALLNMGYTPKAMLQSHLVVFAELEARDYTGIGLTCGGGMVNVCVAYKSVPTLAFSTLRGGDWIDASVAAAVGLSAPLVCAIKEGGVDLRRPKGRTQEAIAIYYRHFIQYTLEMMKRKMEGAHNLPTFAKPVDLVIAGGTSMIGGFAETFREEFDKIEFPIEVAEIRLAKDPLTAVAAGCLQAALAETRALDEGSIDVAPAALERAAVSGPPKARAEAQLQLAAAG